MVLIWQVAWLADDLDSCLNFPRFCFETLFREEIAFLGLLYKYTFLAFGIQMKQHFL